MDYSGEIGENMDDGAVVAPKAMVPKQNVWLYAVIGVLTATVLILVGVLVAVSRVDQEASDNVANANDDQDVQLVLSEFKKDLAVRSLVAEVEAQINEKLSPYSVLLDFYDQSGVVYYQPEDFSTVVSLNKLYGFKVDESIARYNSALQKILQDADWSTEISDLLKVRGFVTDEEQYTSASAGPGAVIYVNKDEGMVCNTTPLTLFLGCGATTWYDESDAALSNELAKVYEKAVGEKARLLLARVSKIENSIAEPYQTIDVKMSGFGALFYRVSPESEWKFFARGQDGPACSQYNTEDLKKAYLGRNCYNEEYGYDAKVEL